MFIGKISYSLALTSIHIIKDHFPANTGIFKYGNDIIVKIMILSCYRYRYRPFTVLLPLTVGIREGFLMPPARF
jgi:hypothetical protein